jgi:exo-beta-1,3-glucanase (GH17 family)
VTDTTTVCGATTTQLPSGTHTIGGVTTVVEHSTTVVCPYATVEPSGSTVTSVIKTTTYVCPSAGTYTIAPTTTYVPTETVVVYPTPATITPGTYTQPEQTVTVTRTDYTYVCPFTGQDQPTSAPTAPSAPAVPTTTPSAPATSAPAPTGATGASPVAGQMGMTYTPYTKDGQCKDKSSVLNEVAMLASKGFTHVRVYGTDCNSLEYIGEAARISKLHMIIGVFITNTGISGAQDQVTTISKWAQWDLVTLIVVGNEAIQNGYVDAASLAGFISSSKSAFQQAGYTGPVTTTEPINVWQAYGSTLCSACDITGANIHPFFNPDVTADQAGKFVAQEIKVLEGICPGKDVINLETGWPHAGKANGKAVPGVSEQAAAIKSIAKEAGSKSVFFSYYDDLWKESGAFDVEQYWGCIDHFN